MPSVQCRALAQSELVSQSVPISLEVGMVTMARWAHNPHLLLVSNMPLPYLDVTGLLKVHVGRDKSHTRDFHLFKYPNWGQF